MALKLLNVKVEKYYASEIDPNAIAVATDNHPGIQHVGDAQQISKEMLQQMCPINLLIGGPPCNNLSRVNPKRKGFGNVNRLKSYNTMIIHNVNLQNSIHLSHLMTMATNMSVEKHSKCLTRPLNPKMVDVLRKTSACSLG